MRVFFALIAAAVSQSLPTSARCEALFIPAAPRHVEGCVEAEITPGSVVEGSLTINDCSLRLFDPNARIGLRTDAYKLVIDTSLIVQVRIESAGRNYHSPSGRHAYALGECSHAKLARIRFPCKQMPRASAMPRLSPRDRKSPAHSRRPIAGW